MEGSSDDGAVEQATALTMDRYDLSQASALGVLARIAGRRKVDLRVIALAVIAAAVARRAAASRGVITSPGSVADGARL